MDRRQRILLIFKTFLVTPDKGFCHHGNPEAPLLQLTDANCIGFSLSFITLAVTAETLAGYMFIWRWAQEKQHTDYTSLIHK